MYCVEAGVYEIVFFEVSGLVLPPTYGTGTRMAEKPMNTSVLRRKFVPKELGQGKESGTSVHSLLTTTKQAVCIVYGYDKSDECFNPYSWHNFKS